MAQLVELHLKEAAVARSAGSDHYMVDSFRDFRQAREESLKLRRVVAVERGGAERAEIDRCALQRVGVAAGEDDVGAFGAGASGCF